MPETSAKLTLLLHRSRAGDALAAEELFHAVYEDLLGIARGLMRAERVGHTLQPTALVGEAWLRLGAGSLEWEDRAHFFRVAARAMRRALVDHARARRAQKRGAGEAEKVPLDEMLAAWESERYDLIDLHEALKELGQLDPQLADIVELRFFAGLTLEETGAAVGLSFQQVHRAWKLARGWLHRRLQVGGEKG